MRIVRMSCTTSTRPAACHRRASSPGLDSGRPYACGPRGIAAGIDQGRRVEDHAMGEKPAAGIPRRRGDDPAASRDPAHLPHGPGRLRDELQDQHRQRVVERGVVERQGAGVSDLERHPRVRAVPLRMRDIGRREVEARHPGDVGPSGQAEGKAAGAATDIEDVPGGVDAGKLDEQRRQTAAPPTHLALVAIAIRRQERRGRRNPAGLVHCGLSPIAFTSAALMAISRSTVAPNSAGLRRKASTPMAVSLSLTLGS